MNVCNITIFVPLYIENNNDEKQKITIVQDAIDLFDELPIEEKIHLILSQTQDTLSVNEISTKIGIKKRTARKCLSRLENKGLVKKEVGKSINNNFRFGDRWYATKNFGISLKDKIYIKYESFHRNNKKTHYIILPSSVRIDKYFASCIGLLDAEKTKFRSKRKTIEFVNSEPLMINRILRFFEIFYVHKELWRWRITINGNIKHLIEGKTDNITNFWIKNTGLPDNMQYNSSPYFTKARGSYKIETRQGSLCLNYNNLLLHNFIDNLLKKVKPLITSDENLTWAYLSGFLCGEAYVGDRKCREIQVGFQDGEQLNFVKELLSNIGIATSYAKASKTSPPKILICGRDNFLKLYERGVFDINLKKKASLIKMLMSYKRLDNMTRSNLKKDLLALKEGLKERELI